MSEPFFKPTHVLVPRLDAVGWAVRVDGTAIYEEAMLTAGGERLSGWSLVDGALAFDGHVRAAAKLYPVRVVQASTKGPLLPGGGT